MKVRVVFDYYPDEPDLDDRMGMSEAEFDRLHEAVSEAGGIDLAVQRLQDDVGMTDDLRPDDVKAREDGALNGA